MVFAIGWVGWIQGIVTNPKQNIDNCNPCISMCDIFNDETSVKTGLSLKYTSHTDFHDRRIDNNDQINAQLPTPDKLI